MKARPYPNRAPGANPSRGDFPEGLRADGPRVCERPLQAPSRRGCGRLGENVNAVPLPRPRAGAAGKTLRGPPWRRVRPRRDFMPLPVTIGRGRTLAPRWRHGSGSRPLIYTVDTIMANSRLTGPLGGKEGHCARTPGPLGHNDAGHPDAHPLLVGDTPGPLGWNDWADPDDIAMQCLAPIMSYLRPPVKPIVSQFPPWWKPHVRKKFPLPKGVPTGHIDDPIMDQDRLPGRSC
jgi:hypothetical protein